MLARNRAADQDACKTVHHAFGTLQAHLGALGQGLQLAGKVFGFITQHIVAGRHDDRGWQQGQGIQAQAGRAQGIVCATQCIPVLLHGRAS
ncbi:hypothetical protein D3C72_2390610 [compost metagenome]